ncbi:unnamed protein product [Chilo suppressalis]|uniref:SPARC-related modular calcium-binding protein 1 n=1 Tax=Chilo suppressalis TaxID=168631 RepID=A0ABN8B518_CHISP|nr:hypothetical protein evm_006127 [Chilo suppressalis]CAH0401942.1 unnamed protein product [Chilo suppressalis]
MYINYFVSYLFFLDIIYFVSGAAPNVQTSTQVSVCSTRASSCETSAGTKRPVCGTDGRTYPTRCHLMKAQCSSEPVAIAHKGPCLEGQSSCMIALRYALNAQSGRRAPFVPRCRADGTYAAVQCASAGAAASCWCVSPDGKPLPDTAVRNGRPDCTRTGKSHTRRRSSVRGQRNKRSCTRTDRALFNGNLIKIFGGDYERVRPANSAPPEPREVADWKFRELDRDKSDTLRKSEYRGLRRLIKKVVKPKRCARAWARGCDGDGDGEIAHEEWVACLLVNPEPPAPDFSLRFFMSLNADEDSAPEAEPDYNEEEPPPEPSAVMRGIMRNSFAPDGQDAESRREDEANDCLTDRQAVLDEQKAGGAVLYVPECTGDGRYARAQCYRSTGYCWCVHQDTGKPIPGSSVKDRKPDCDAAPQHASPMRGCPEKSKFLRDLRNFFITKMTAATNGTGPGEMVRWGASNEEQAATWTYVMLDKDKNKALERREWKAFHQLIANVDQLRRCGRKLPRYCDVNHDTKISITEWMACLEVTQASHGPSTESTKPPSNPRRKGPNPLESILKADD